MLPAHATPFAASPPRTWRILSCHPSAESTAAHWIAGVGARPATRESGRAVMGDPRLTVNVLLRTPQQSHFARFYENWTKMPNFPIIEKNMLEKPQTPDQKAAKLSSFAWFKPPALFPASASCTWAAGLPCLEAVEGLTG